MVEAIGPGCNIIVALRMGSIMEKIDTLLEEMLDKGDPEQELDLIVRSDGDIEPHLQKLYDMQFQVRHRFRLRPGAAVRGRARRVKELMGEPWVLRIEIDRPVSTQ
jgi:hypothetical protein